MRNAAEVVAADLNHIRGALAPEWPRLSGRRVLMTGGAGFLGHYMVQALTHFNRDAAPKHRIAVSVWDNLARGMPEWLSGLVDRREVEFQKYDLRFPLPERMPEFDYILHGASIASPTFYRAHPVETMDGNTNGLRSLLDYALKRQNAGRPIQAILFWSSSEIYGDPEPSNIPTPETYRGNVSCTGPRACYDEAKRYGETLCWVFARQHGVPTKVARPFNNYGPGLKINDGRVIPDFARAVLSGRDITMLSDGSPKRTFCYAADAAAGYYKVLVGGGIGEAYNVGIETPEISMRDLAERIRSLAGELVGYKGKVVVQESTEKDYLVDNPNRRSPQIGKARQQVGYNPTIALEDGLRRTLLWYRDHRAEAQENWVPAQGPAA
jgi:nucleoside-diphosphate-sugar epimerase